MQEPDIEGTSNAARSPSLTEGDGGFAGGLHDKLTTASFLIGVRRSRCLERGKGGVAAAVVLPSRFAVSRGFQSGSESPFFTRGPIIPSCVSCGGSDAVAFASLAICTHSFRSSRVTSSSPSLSSSSSSHSPERLQLDRLLRSNIAAVVTRSIKTV